MNTEQPMYQHFINSAQFAEYLKFYLLPYIDGVNTTESKKLRLHNMLWLKISKLLMTVRIGPIYDTPKERQKNFNYSNDFHDCATF